MIIWFGGGLGNQMFQYALYKSAECRGVKVKGDLNYFRSHKCHNGFELHRVFNIKINNINRLESMYFRIASSNKLRNSPLGLISKCVLYESDMVQHKNVLEAKNKYVKGFWQNENYFYDIRDILLTDFAFPGLNSHNSKLATEIQSYQSVSLHIRRGDYLSNKNIKYYRNLTETDYYQKAIKYISDNFEDTRFYVFSDDIVWCRENMNLPQHTSFICSNNGSNSFVDMHLMSLCKHNIIANSTFSWWGAWLNKNDSKCVIAPKIWFLDNYSKEFDLPKGWILL